MTDILQRGFPRLIDAAKKVLRPRRTFIGHKISSWLSALFFLCVAACAPNAVAQTTSGPQIGLIAPDGCNGLASISAWGTWLGKPAQHLTDNWDHSTWTNLLGDVNYGVRCYKSLQGSVNFTFGLPMIPADGVSTLAQGAAGAYDAYFLTIATSLVAGGYSNATLRIGWEFNGAWFPWASYKDPANFIAYWQRIVTVMRSVPGQQFTFDWCPSLGANALAPDQSYPGDAYVDYVGEDIYDAVWNTSMAVPWVRMNQFINEPYGLSWQVNMATKHHKLLSLPEWGVGGKNSGDDPYFVNAISSFTKAHGYSYIDYWNLNSGGYNGMLTNGQYPQSAKAFIADFSH
jgi:hypothetical protein